jgi:hypothetical protein
VQLDVISGYIDLARQHAAFDEHLLRMKIQIEQQLSWSRVCRARGTLVRNIF